MSKYRYQYSAAAMAAFSIMLGSPAADAKNPKGAWTVTRSADPITGKTSCTVSALDRLAGMRFSRVGILYAVVENNPEAGLLVGVSSGGRWRLPTGDIIWGVDDKPHRTLRAADNPPMAGAPSPYATAIAELGKAEPTAGSATDAFTQAYGKTLETTMSHQTKLVAAITATATMASGDTARAMLAEMLAGTSLMFRQEAAVPAYGLPSSRMHDVGQDTSKGHKPIPIDQSFRDGLIACGISISEPQP